MNRSILVALLAAAATAGAARADFTVTGRMLYRDRPFTYNSGFTSGTPTLPVRLASVQVRDANTGAILGARPTDENGDFSVFVAGSGPRDILVRCLSRSTTFGSNRVRVQNTSGVLYSIDTATFAGWDQNVDLDVGTTVAEKIFSGSFQANPWNMLDMGVHAVQYIQSLGAPNLPANVNVQWPGGSGSFAFGSTANMSDDDGYDDMVILHELGHVIHNLYSDSDSPGGSHTFGDSDQDPRLSYGEGWATFFAGAVRQHMGIFDPAFYMDASGTSSGFVQLRARLENATPYSNSTAGEANELGVACVLWDIVDTTATNDGSASDDDPLNGTITFNGLDGDQMQWASFTGPVSTSSSLTIRNHWNGFFAPVNHGNYDALRDVFDAFEIRNYLDPEEPNNSTGQASSIASDGSWSAIKSLYYSAASPPAPGGGDVDVYSFDLTAGDGIDVETRYPNGSTNARTYADTFLVLRRPDGSVFASDSNSGFGRNAAILGLTADATGTWTAEVSSIHSYRRTGSYQIRVDRVGFSVTSVDPPTIPAVSDPTQIIDVFGVGFDDATGVSMDGIPLDPFVFGTGNYLVLSDSQIRIFQHPFVSKLGAVDIVVQGPGTFTTAQVNVVEAPVPVLSTPSALTDQFTGVEMTIGAHLADWCWVCVSFTEQPSLFPGLTDLAIGAGGSDLFVVWKPFIPASGHATLVSGDVSGNGLGGLTLFWQAFVLEAANNYEAPWPSSNVKSTRFVF